MFLLTVVLLSYFAVFSSLAFSATRRSQENYVQKIKELNQDIVDLRNDFFDKTMQNVNFVLQGANRVTILVSVFAIMFTTR